jgi:hypothetical protein
MRGLIFPSWVCVKALPRSPQPYSSLCATNVQVQVDAFDELLRALEVTGGDGADTPPRELPPHQPPG